MKLEPIALVTASIGGIGAKVAEVLAARGYQRVLMDLDRSRLEQQVTRFKGARIERRYLSDGQAILARARRQEEPGARSDLAFINAGLP